MSSSQSYTPGCVIDLMQTKILEHRHGLSSLVVAKFWFLSFFLVHH